MKKKTYSIGLTSLVAVLEDCTSQLCYICKFVYHGIVSVFHVNNYTWTWIEPMVNFGSISFLLQNLLQNWISRWNKYLFCQHVPAILNCRLLSWQTPSPSPLASFTDPLLPHSQTGCSPELDWKDTFSSITKAQGHYPGLQGCTAFAAPLKSFVVQVGLGHIHIHKPWLW